MTTPSPFVHLHVHTMYSLLDGAIRIDRLVARAREYGMTHVAITDHGTMFGVIDFYDAARKAGLTPVIGCECYVAPRRCTDKTPRDQKDTTHLVLLARNHTGYQNLCRLATIAQLEGFYYKPRIDRDLLEAHHEGLIGLSACLHGDIPMRIQSRDRAGAEKALGWYQRLFGEENFFLEVQHNGIPAQETVNAELEDMARRCGAPLVATNDCHYLGRDEVRAHDVLLCIQTGKTLDDPNRLQFRTDQLYFKSPEEMQARFGDTPGAIANTLEIARRCQVEFDFGTYHFPTYTDPGAPEGMSAAKLFDRKVIPGFDARMEKIRRRTPAVDEQRYKERLAYEIGVIKEMGFAGYFLIVADFIAYAKTHGIPVGPGRGSAAGSMVAYSLGITDLDPIEHGLIFERFLNPSRQSMPDIDVDFCINGRERVFKYVVDKYGGGDHVAQIITFGKLKTRAVIRDVGRVLDIPLKEVDQIAKLVPEVLNISLDKALEQEPRLREMAAERADVGDLIQICRVLEGLPRHASTHAAGVVIGDRPLVEHLPLYRGKKGEVVTQFDMKRVEQIGLVKFDFLGLRNLTVIETALGLIEAGGEQRPDLANLDLADAATYRLLAAGDTTGVFQLESSGMKDLLVRLKPACFDDVIALVALYRPGPLDSGMVDDFVERKHGRKAVAYLVPELEPILASTYGVIVYQEQVMQIAGALASYSMAEADGLRKAMGKKIAEMMARHRDLFMTGAVKNGIPEDKARQIFDLMEKFGGYGFNKSHSAAYALIAFQTAWLKAHYPVAFMAALLTSEMTSIDGVVKFSAECRARGIEILPPDINHSEKAFSVVDGRIRFGLLAVKNVGEGAIDAVLEARAAGGRFDDLYAFCERVDLRRVNKRVAEALIKCGAFDSTGAPRAAMLAGLEEALEFGQRIQKERASPQMGLFDAGPDPAAAINRPGLPPLTEWDDVQRLAFEKEALGFYISGHPLARFEAVLDTFATVNALTLPEAADGLAVRVGGLVRATRVLRTRKGDLMAFVTLEDLHGAVEAVIFPEVYARTAELLAEDAPILVQGQTQKEENAVKVLADAVVPLEQAESAWAASVHLTLDGSAADRGLLERLHAVLLKHPGSCPGFVHVTDPVRLTETVVEMGARIRLEPGAALVRDVDALLGPGRVETRCKPVETTANGNGRNGRRGRVRA